MSENEEKKLKPKKKRRKRKPNKPYPDHKKTEIELTSKYDKTKWPRPIDIKSIPYVSHVPKNPIQMDEKKKKRIRSAVWWHNKGKDIKWIAEKLKTTPTTIKRDLTTAVVLTNEAMPYVPKLERQIMTEVKTSVQKAGDLYDRVEDMIATLEQDKESITSNSKKIMAYSMLIGELRQSLELTAKLTGELQTGTRVNVVVFSDLVKRMIEIIRSEVDLETFERIRDRIRLEMQGAKPLGQRGGEVQIVEQDGE